MLRRKKWKIYTFWILLSLAVGVFSGVLSGPGMEDFRETVVQPAWAPPAIVFPIVWTLLYVLMGIGAAKIWMAGPSQMRSQGLNLFVAQLVVNFFWSLIFFNLQAFGLAFAWLIVLWVLVAWMIWTFRKVDPPAAWLQLTYLLWLTFAGYLSFAVWVLNR